MSELRPLSVRDVYTLLERAPTGVEDLVLVGGQALNFWAEVYGLNDPKSELKYGALVSADIDFLGATQVALELGKAWHAEVKIAAPDDHTPNTAVVAIEYEGGTRTIDFLDHIQGLALDEVKKWAVPMPIYGGRTFKVLHAFHCLGSQLENVYGTKINRRASPHGERYQRRIQLAAGVVERAIREYLEKGMVDDALTMAERVFELARTAPALRALEEDGVDIVQGTPLDAAGWPEKFLFERHPRLVEYLRRKRGIHARRKASRPKQ